MRKGLEMICKQVKNLPIKVKLSYFSNLRTLLLILLSSLVLPIQASAKNVNWLPVIATSPETGVQYGVLAIQNLDKKAVDGKLSTIQYIAINSTESQQQLVLRPTIYKLDRKLRIAPIINYSSFPSKYYGISNDADEDNEESYTSEFLKLKLDLRYNFYSDFHIKLLASNDDREITKFEEGKLVDGEILTSSDAYKLSSAGLGFIWDARDIQNYPTKGYYAELSQEDFKGGEKDIYDYSEKTIDLRAFFPIAEKQVIALHALRQKQSSNDGGQVPFINYATIGGSDVVRGVFEGQYRAPEMEAVQIEYRKSGYEFLNWDAGFTVFAATGRVDASELIANDPDDLHSAAGFGGHFFFNPEDQTTIRLDLAFGDDGTSVYFMLGQAF